MRGLWFLDFTYWLTWVSLAIGLGVGGLVYTFSPYILRKRRPHEDVPAEEDLPWDELLDLLKSLQQGEGGDLAEGLSTCPPDELLRRLLEKMPELSRNPRQVSQDDVPLGVSGGHERRRSRRRWSKPVEVRITAPLHEKPVHGVVINRSTGGVAILADTDFPVDTVLFLRSLQAQPSVPTAKLPVRHSRQSGKLSLTGCQYHEDVLWSVKVWFG